MGHSEFMGNDKAEASSAFACRALERLKQFGARHGRNARSIVGNLNHHFTGFTLRFDFDQPNGTSFCTLLLDGLQIAPHHLRRR